MFCHSARLQITPARFSKFTLTVPYGLFHYSKNEGFWDRFLRQRTKHKQRLSGDASLDAYEMPKPKGMWWRTYYRLQRAAERAENRAAEDFITAAGRLLKVGWFID